MALICTLTLLLAQIYETPDPALTVYITFFLNKPDRTTSLIMNIAFVIIITILIGIVFLIADHVLNDPAARLAAMAVVSFLLLFLTSASKLKPIGAIAALIIVYALAVLGIVPAGELATRGLLYAWLFVGIPAGVSLIVNLLFAPSPRKLVDRALAGRLRAAAQRITDTGERTSAEVQKFRAEGVAATLKQLHLAGLERSISPADRVALVEAAHQTDRLLLLADALGGADAVPADWRTSTAETVTEMAAIFERGGYPINIRLDGIPAEPAVPAMAPRLMEEVGRTLEHFTGPPPEMPGETAHVKSGFFLPDAFTNPGHVLFALKVTAAAMTCYLLYSLLDWTGIHTALITCYIVSLGTAAETIEKLSLRIVGCLVGAATGLATLIWILPSLQSIEQFLALIFVATLPAAWIAAGSPRVSYAGFQFAFAFFLCTIQGSGPAYDLSIARDRVIGILLGNLVSYLFLTGIRPTSIANRVDSALADLLRALSRIARAGAGGRRVLVPAFQVAINAAREDVRRLKYEPAPLRASPPWVDRRRTALAEIALLESAVLLSGNERSDSLDHIAKSLEAIAARLEAGLSRSPTAAADTPLDELHASTDVQSHLNRLDRSLADHND